jgi:hypothetical protein
MAADDPAGEELRALLRAASIEPAPEELGPMAAMYRYYRRGTDLLYAVEGVRFETPALAFDARPPQPRWEDGR